MAIPYCPCQGHITLRGQAIRTGLCVGGKSQWNTKSWHVALQGPTLVITSGPQESFSCSGSWVPQGVPWPRAIMHQAQMGTTGSACWSAPVDTARHLSSGGCRLQDIHSPVPTLYVLPRGYASGWWRLWALTGKPGAGSRKVGFRLLRCLHRPQSKLC